MSRARETIEVPLAPDRAEALWTDVRRWPSFMEGFKHAREAGRGWPEPGGRVVWESIPGGRGLVTEKVREREAGRRLVTDVFEERMAGRQVITFTPSGDGATLVELVLEYELAQGGPLRAVANALFIRRAVSDSLARTLRRYATEAAEEAEYE